MTTIIIPSSCLVLVECSYSTVLRRFSWNLNYIQQILTVVQDFGKDMNSLFLASISSKNKGRLMYEKCVFLFIILKKLLLTINIYFLPMFKLEMWFLKSDKEKYLCKIVLGMRKLFETFPFIYVHWVSVPTNISNK